MVHLSVAQRLIGDHGFPASPAFYLGSISPDAIHVRPGTERSDKLAVHLIGEQGPEWGRLKALLAEGRVAAGGHSVAAGFAAGYVSHVLTDSFWRDEVLLPFRKRFLDHLSYPELRALYYSECDRNDLDLYDEQPWRPQVWKWLRVAQAQAAAVSETMLLSSSEVDGWRHRVLGWFDAHRDKANYEPQQITRELMQAFIREATTRVAAQMAELN
jgi:hypothetical protein